MIEPPSIDRDSQPPSRSRILLPVFLIFLSLGVLRRFRWHAYFSLTLLQSDMKLLDGAVRNSFLFGNLGGGLLAGGLGHRARAVKLLVLTSLGLTLVTCGALLDRGIAWPLTIHLAVVGITVSLVSLVLTGYLLRAVSIREAYLALLCSSALEGLGSAFAEHCTTSQDSTALHLSLVVGACLLAFSSYSLLLRPELIPARLDEPNSPADVAPVRVIHILLIICLFFIFNREIVSIGKRLIYPVGNPPSLLAAGTDNLPFLLVSLLLPMLAYRQCWRPLVLLLEGMLITVIGGLASGAVPSRTLAVVGRGITSFGQGFFFPAQALLLRQMVPLPRIVTWLAVDLGLNALLSLGNSLLLAKAWIAYSPHITILMTSCLAGLVALYLRSAARRVPFMPLTSDTISNIENR